MLALNKYIFLSQKECQNIIDECKSAVKDTITDLREYIRSNDTFGAVGGKIIDVWEFSLTQKDTIKELPDDIIQTW